MSFRLLRARTAGQCHLLPLLLLHLVPGFLLLLFLRPASASAPTVVTHLPGYDGPLPFNLETGYVGVEEETGTELFYYFVESERSPGTDPVLLWLTGGPRCSVIMGLAFEIGPLRFVRAPYSGGLPELIYNPHSWTKMANILLLDSPVGSGFSYARDPKGYDVGDYSSSLHVQRFLNKWFTDHPRYLSNPFYLAGDSYAGKVIPLIAQDISEGNEMGQQPIINLKGYMVGNPITDPMFDENFRIPSAHGFGIISDQIYEASPGAYRGQCHLLPLLLLHLVPGFLLLLFLRPASASAPTVVTHLPGYPFNLETGYVGVEEETGTELFYYFVESERSPGTDPVLLWLTGGPRCSVIMGLAFEIGPLRFVRAPYSGGLPELIYNPHSWTKMANILLLDSPVGSGFSYARDPKGYDVRDYSSSLHVQRFLNKWFTDHPRYLSNPFYLAGDSYAGKVIPLIAQDISEGNEMGQQPIINLKGYMVGNPITDPMFDENFRIPSAHGFGIISDQIYETARKSCKGDYVNPSNKMCAEVLHTINNLISEISIEHILYDKCDVVAPNSVDDNSRRKFLLEGSIQISKPPSRPTVDCFGTVGEWIQCNVGLPYTFEIRSSVGYHLNLTTRGYHALVYSGDHDLEAPFLGTHAWIRSLNFSIVDDWRAWHLNGQAAGFTIKYENNMTFATVKGAGHTAPEYRPEECFAMAQRWLDNEPL